MLAWAQVKTQWTVLLKQDGPMLNTNNTRLSVNTTRSPWAYTPGPR